MIYIKAISSQVRTLSITACLQKYPSAILDPLHLWGRVCHPRHRRNHRRVAGAGAAQGGQIVEERGAVLSSLAVGAAAWVSHFGASSVVSRLRQLGLFSTGGQNWF